MEEKIMEITNIFEALKKIKELENKVEGDSRKLEGYDQLQYKELMAYVDTILKSELPKRPRFTIVEKKTGSEEPSVCEVKFKNAVQFYESLHLNISKGGCFIKEENVLPIDTLLSLKCSLEEEGIDFTFTGKVIWVNPKETSGRPAGMGIKFQKLNQVQKQLLDEFMAGAINPSSLSHLGEM
jgi:uncharacterized protein (TIGR02266 family)